MSVSEQRGADIDGLRISNVFHISMTCFMKKYEHWDPFFFFILSLSSNEQYGCLEAILINN